MATKKRGRGRPKLIGQDSPGPLIGVRLNKGMTERVDRYRKAQEDKPERTSAIRRLVEMALKAAGF